jgi:signal transduction histidine kinase/CheY-like chemotaxis protein
MECLVHVAALAGEADVAAARQRSRFIATRLGLEPWAQTRLAAAVTEAARDAFASGTDGSVSFLLEGRSPTHLMVRVTDRGRDRRGSRAVGSQGPDRESALSGARRLLDVFEANASDAGTTVRLGCALADEAFPDDTSLRDRATWLAAALDAGHLDDDVAVQDHELLTGLMEIDRLNAELEDTNRGVVALYAELDERAEQLRQASELKSRFLSNMSHEFRTPLNSILALARLLMDRTDGPLTEEQDKQVGYIRRSAESLAELVNDLLDLAKVEAGKLEPRPQPFSVQALFGGLRGVMKPLQQSDAVDLSFDDPVDCPELLTDEAKVSQVLRNLISNALKFTDHGEVRVGAVFDHATGMITFSVRDTGIGIAPENHELVFQEFSQVANRLQGRTKGTGLGLPLSRRLAELLGGTLMVRSVLGAGSHFMLAIPAVLPSAGPIATQNTKPTSTILSKSGGVLVIDDEEASRYVLRQTLMGVPDIQVLEAETGALGLHRAAQDRPDVILLDLRMPGMDGFEVLDRLANNPDTRSIPVIICTSSILESDDQARLLRAHMVLSKAGLSREAMTAAVLPLLTRATPHISAGGP